MRNVERRPWPHWTSLNVNTLVLHGEPGARTVRVVCFERLETGEGTQMAASHVPRHRNSYDVLYANLELPLADSGADPVEPIGGAVSFRPECLLTEGGPMPLFAPPVDHAEVNIYLHTQGPSGEPLLALSEIASMVEELDRESPGALRHERGEYVTADGEVREALEVCWERSMGRAFPYPDPPRLDTPLNFAVEAYPWFASPTAPGVNVKFLAAFGPTGPAVKLIRLDEDARLERVTLDGDRFVAVLAGGIVYGDDSIGDLNVLLGSPGDQVDTIVAEQRTLLWVVDWPPTEYLAGMSPAG